MLYSSLFTAVAAFAATAAAQSSTSSAQSSSATGSSSASLQYPGGPNGTTLANPGRVPIARRIGWCNAQRNTCPLLCGDQGWTTNDCVADTLTFNCTCRSGTVPNFADYEQTLPYFICVSDRDLCTSDHPNDAVGQANCQKLQCGSKNATTNAAAVTSSSSSSMTTTMTTSGGSQSPTAAQTSSTSSRTGGAVHVANDYGTAALLSTLFAVFGFLA